jgi:5-formyltetrahydrofolate cyclo-ligase
MSDTRTERQQLRHQMLAERNRIGRAHRRGMSKQIVEAVAGLPVFKESHVILIYCSYQSEVETFPLLHRCLAEGKIVCVPLAVPEHSRLLVVAITDPLLDLAPGYKGIPEPVLSLVERQTRNPKSLEVILMPGAVFDRAGNRLGYGGGYYDRFLAQVAPQAVRIGLAFSGQLVSKIPALPHDVPMDVLVTENEVFTWMRSGDAKSRGI